MLKPDSVDNVEEISLKNEPEEVKLEDIEEYADDRCCGQQEDTTEVTNNSTENAEQLVNGADVENGESDGVENTDSEKKCAENKDLTEKNSEETEAKEKKEESDIQIDN